MSWIIVMLFAAVLASLVQGVTGFGSGIMLMIFLPTMLPIGQSAGVSTLTMLIAEVVLVWRYRHALKWRRLPIPFLIYASVATWSVHLGQILPTHFLKGLLGCLLIALCLYFTFNRAAGNKRFPLLICGAFMIVSGFFNGLFGIGGPLMALYFLTLSKTKEEYLVSIQTFFLIDTFYVTTVRFANQVLSVGDLKYVAVGMVGAVIGTIIANHIVDHLNVAMITRIVYGFIGVAGLYYLSTAIVTGA